jgi:hypothetical protein
LSPITVTGPLRLTRAKSCRQTSRSLAFGEVNAIALGVPSGAIRVCSRSPQK